jgi:hypothetical protein
MNKLLYLKGVWFDTPVTSKLTLIWGDAQFSTGHLNIIPNIIVLHSLYFGYSANQSITGARGFNAVSVAAHILTPSSGFPLSWVRGSGVRLPNHSMDILIRYSILSNIWRFGPSNMFDGSKFDHRTGSIIKWFDWSNILMGAYHTVAV